MEKRWTQHDYINLRSAADHLRSSVTVFGPHWTTMLVCLLKRKKVVPSILRHTLNIMNDEIDKMIITMLIYAVRLLLPFRQTKGNADLTLDRLVIELPEDVKKRLKTYCATNGKTMRTEVLAMICQTLEAYEEAIEEENSQARAPQGSSPSFIKTNSNQQIKKTETEEMLRKALGLRPKEKHEIDLFDANDPLNIGFG